MTPDELRQAHIELRDRLIGAGLLIPTGVDGLYGRSATFERVLDGIDRAARALGETESPTAVEYPPLLPKPTFDKIGYLRNFPQLVGPVFSFAGGDREHAELIRRLDGEEPYADVLSQSEVALTPACCYPVYPSATGTLPEGGRIFTTRNYCFRHEPSVDPMRLQAFRMREHIRITHPDDVLEWRDLWLGRALTLLQELGLDVRADFANDPFFGRAGRLMQRSQREQELKTEFLVPVFGEEHPTACASVNYHQNHFGHLFGISTADGEEAHSSCVGFGLERCTVALFAAHGTEPDRWPTSVQQRLWG